MKIEAIITSVNYSDFLSHSLPETLQHVDNVVVVTSREDKKTKDLCNFYGVNCVETEVFFEHQDKFNKGRGINLGLAHLRHDDWLLHLDADTMLPHRFRYMLTQAGLDKENIYGVDRLNTKSHQNYQDAKTYLTPQWKHGCLINAHAGFDLGARLKHGDYGYCPIGYFQLWHSSQKRRYPTAQGSAEHTDVLFATQWARKNRILLPDLFVYHLESEEVPMGTNWEGRKTKHFGPCCPCHKRPKHHECHCHCHHHRHHPHPKPYCPK